MTVRRVKRFRAPPRDLPLPYIDFSVQGKAGESVIVAPVGATQIVVEGRDAAGTSVQNPSDIVQHDKCWQQQPLATFVLTLPPSVWDLHVFGRFRGKVRRPRSPEYNAWREKEKMAVWYSSTWLNGFPKEPLNGPLKIVCRQGLPKPTIQDTDNYVKAIPDLLKDCGVIAKDSADVVVENVQRYDKAVPQGQVIVEIWRMP